MDEIVVVITGGSSGIGEATAMEFAATGSSLVLSGRRAEALQKTAEKLQQQTGLDSEKILLVPGDVTVESDNENLITKALDKFPRIDVLVNSAGHVVTGTPENCTLEDMDAMYKVHIRGPLQLCQLAMPYLAKTKGCIVNISSLSGLKAAPGVTCYSIAKAGMDMMTKVLALDAGPKGVRVNSVNPGYILTNMLTDSFGGSYTQETLDHAATAYPLGRIGHAEEVGKTVHFLASPGAGFISGVNLAIDGGKSATSRGPTPLQQKT